MVFRELKLDDMKDKFDMKGTLFDVLLATAERAIEIHDEEEAAEAAAAQTQPTQPKRRREAPAAAVEEIPDEDTNCASSSTEPERRRRVIIIPPHNGEEQRPPLPETFKNAIREMGEGTLPTLVIQKELFSTDLSVCHNRLSIPIRQIVADDFLTEEERQKLRGYDGKGKKNYLEVKIVQPSLAVVTAKFRRWDMPKDGGKTSSSYVINGKWKSIVQTNNFRLGMIIQLWSFRVDGHLCFALVLLPRNH